jgi:hypothetical protein
MALEPESSSSSSSSASGAVTLAREAGNAQIFKPLNQFGDSPAAGLSPREASHDRLPQVDAKGLDFNAFFQGLAGISSCKSVAHAALLDICLSKDLQK